MVGIATSELQELQLASAPQERRLCYGSMTRSPQVDDDLAALLHRVAANDAAAFADFYDRTKARVFGLVFRVVRDQGFSEETTQEVYLQVWQNAGQFNPCCGIGDGMAADAGTPARCRQGPGRASCDPA